MTEYASIEALLEAEEGANIHIECGTGMSMDILDAVRAKYGATRRCAFVLAGDLSFERESIRSYLTLFAKIAGTKGAVDETIAHFGLKDDAKRTLKSLTHAQRMLVDLARASLAEPEVCFCERPLADLDAEARHTAISWIASRTEAGTVFVTTAEPLREAMLMPGRAFWCEDGRFIAAEVEEDEGSEDEGDAAYLGDEVHVCKIPAKTEGSTLLFDPKDIDFVESLNKANYVSVRGTLYQTTLTMDELESELVRFGFFRCHRSYIVNVQKVAKVERYTRNSFNLTLNDAAASSVPLAKGRAEEMRARYGW